MTRYFTLVLSFALMIGMGPLFSQNLEPTLSHDLVKGAVSNERNLGVPGVIEFHDPLSDQMVEKARLNTAGEFEILLPKGKQYYFVIRNGKFTYFFKDQDHIIKTNAKAVKSTLSLNFSIYQYSSGTDIILHDLHFASSEFTVLDKHISSLVFLKKFLLANPNMKIQVAGHTDNVGTEASNKSLSQKRAESVMNYLVGTGGIAEDRVQNYGYGEDRPISDNNHSAGRALNRRTSFIIIENQP